MGKDKLRRFREFQEFSNAFDFPYQLKGKWKKEVFKNDRPLVLELGCGKGEYTVALARRLPQKNFLGLDIKSNRMWKGAGIALTEGLANVAFVRAQADRTTDLFDASEISEIWITFADPFPRERHTPRRLTSPGFLSLYRQVLAPGGSVHLKTDNTGLFDYTLEVLAEMGIEPQEVMRDVHADPAAAPELLEIRTHYEQLFMTKGETIKYVRFVLN